MSDLIPLPTQLPDKVVALVVFLFLMSAVAALTVIEPLVRWIFAGTLAAMALIVAVWFLRKRSARPGNLRHRRGTGAP